MQDIFDDLHQRSVDGGNFKNLMQYISCESNIKLAYRNIKKNAGSNTKGTDYMTIKNIERMEVNDFVHTIQSKFANYQPKAVRRVEIPKEGSDKTRPLGIPTIYDRLIQQCILQVMEPICEAKFHENSNGFRPNRGAEQAISQCYKYIQVSNLHYCVDIDIQGFFDNVNHSKLLKQIWTMGIRDKQLLAIIGKMLKAPIKMPDKTIVLPTKGTPQGGILSPLLSNIVLNELDWWISSNWENMPTRYDYYTHTTKNGTVARSGAHEALKKTNVKEMWIVRYADDFKIFCKNHESAIKTFHAVKGWLKDRLKLDISTEKSKVVNLRKRHSEFLGFKIKVHRKRKKYVVTSSMSDKAVQKATTKLIEQIKRIQRPKDEKDKYRMILDYNSKVMGIHNYYKFATYVNLDCQKIAYQVMIVMKNRLRKSLRSEKYFLKRKQKVPDVAKYISNRYGKSKQLRFVSIYPIAPIGYVQNKYPMFKKKSVNKYTAEGRAEIHQYLGIDTATLLALMKNPVNGRSIQYADNRISLYAGQYGRCAVTGIHLDFDDIHCHHKTPCHKGGSDEYKNLIIVHQDIHRLIHATDAHVINRYLSDYTGIIKLSKLNELRNAVGNEEIISLDNSTAN
jgi:group II intron reverse transcriptase/maturase